MQNFAAPTRAVQKPSFITLLLSPLIYLLWFTASTYIAIAEISYSHASLLGNHCDMSTVVLPETPANTKSQPTDQLL